MRSFFFYLLLLCALGGLLSALGPVPCGLAASAKPAAKTSARERRLADAQKRFDALTKDSKKGWLRDSWLALEADFQNVAGKAKDDVAARGLYMRARSREELANRSFIQKDRKAAADYYADVARLFPKHALAAESRTRQALQEAKLQGQGESAPPADKAPAASGPVLRKISWKGVEGRGVIVLELDAPAGYQYEYLPAGRGPESPARIALDLPGVSAGTQVKDRLSPKNLPVSRIATDKRGAATSVTLECTDLACYAVSSPKPGVIHIEVSRKNDIKGGVRVLGGAKKRSGGRAASGALMEQLGLTVQTIMLDAGHGGKDPGAMAGDMVESRLTLKMVLLLGEMLKDQGYTVLYTRATNVFIPLENRPVLANEKKADLFISIHCNANKNAATNGLETYFLDSAKSSSAATVAARENDVSVKNISDVQFILTDLMLNSKLEESRAFAECAQRGMLARLKKAGFAHNDNGARSAPFYVLMGARMPAILVELGYLTNKDDAARLKSDIFLTRLAEGLVNSIADYKTQLARITR